MLKRLVTRSLRRLGIKLPFTDVICAEHIKSIVIGADGRAKVTVQEKLVFLDVPEPGDLQELPETNAPPPIGTSSIGAGFVIPKC